MKKIYTLLVFVLLSVQMRGQEVRFIEEGKTWHVELDYCGVHNERFVDFMFTSDGDTIIDGKKYKQMYWKYHSFSDEIRPAYLFREENRKVYRYIPKYKKEEIYLDFTLEQNDVLTIPFSPNDSDYYTIEVTEVDSITLSNGSRAKRIRFLAIPSNEPTIITENVWIEGIGNTVMPAISINDDSMTKGGSAVLKSVIVGEKMLYDASPVGITDVGVDKKGKMYDLQGRALSIPPKRGFYIKDGRKFRKK